jgi:hypothetical protein
MITIFLYTFEFTPRSHRLGLVKAMMDFDMRQGSMA